MSSIGVVVAHDEQAVTERIGAALEAVGDLFVAGTAVEALQSGHVLVAGGAVLQTLRAGLVAPVVALAEADVIRAARAAVSAGAREILRWPEEAEQLAAAVRRVAGTGPEARGGGRVVAVRGATGGSGASTLAMMLAAALGDAIVADLDPVVAGQRAFCASEPQRTLGSIDIADGSPDVLAAALVPAAGGVRALHVRLGDDAPSAAVVHGVARAARALAPWAVLDAGRGAVSSAAFDAADERIVVVCNDVASVRCARPLIADARVVVRRARRDGVALRDIEAALGVPVACVIPEDRMLARAVDLGALPSKPTRAMRAVQALAEALR